MGTTAVRRYRGQGLKPSQQPNRAKTDAIRLIPGTYTQGTVLGEFATLTAAQDVQTITVSGTPTGGSFYLYFNGELLGPIAYNASVAAVQAVFDASTQLGTAGVVVAGSGAFPGNTMTVTFQGGATNLYQPLMTLAINALTGGTSPSVSVAHTTPGRAAGGLFAAYDDSQSDGRETAKCVLAYNCVVNVFGEITVGSGEWSETGFTVPAFFSGIFYSAELTGLDAAAVTDLNARFLNGSIATVATAGVEILIP